MPFNSSILIETPSASCDNLAGSLDVLQGCWKCSSLLWMQTNGFPVLPGLILKEWLSETEAAVSRFCRERNFSELLVRIEKPGQRWTRRRGGYTIPVSAARSLVDDLAKEGMLAQLLEPASPYSDLFSLTSVCDLLTGKLDIEVVGPGFDASDILRADVLPHERFEVFVENREVRTIAVSSLQQKRLHVVGRGDYQASFRRRLVKVGARLRNPSFPDEVSATASDPERQRLAEEAVHFLQASGQTLLLDHAARYEPIPARLLNLFLKEFLRLFGRIRSSNIQWRTLSLASSFLPQDRLVIWDFFPVGEHDTSVLSRL